MRISPYNKSMVHSSTAINCSIYYLVFAEVKDRHIARVNKLIFLYFKRRTEQKLGMLLME
jgi:hypothetical protein